MKKSINNISEWVINSKQFFWIAFSLIALSSILQIILFLSNVTVINGSHFNEVASLTNFEEASIFIRLIFSSIGSVLATLGLLLINRNNKNFFYFSLTASFLLMLNGVFSNLFFDAIKWLMVGLVLFTQAIIWNKKDRVINIRKIGAGYICLIILITFVLSFLIGYFLISPLDSTSIFYNKKPILDPVQFSFTIIGNILMIFFIVESRIIYLIGNIITMIMFAMIVASGDVLSVTQLIQSIIYIVITISGYIKINKKYKEVNKNA